MTARRFRVPLFLVASATVRSAEAFAPHRQSSSKPSFFPVDTVTYDSSSTSLGAIGVLARKAKEAEVRKYCEAGPEPETLEAVKTMKTSLEAGLPSPSSEPGPLQQALTKRKGTISIVAEYKRRIDNGGYIDEAFGPEILSPAFREFFASAASVAVDERTGGCTYDDLRAFAVEQGRAKGEMPGPCPVICNDVVVDEVQIARAKAFGADAVTIDVGVLGGAESEKLGDMVNAARAMEMEVVAEVTDEEEARAAVEAGATIISVLGSAEPAEKYKIVSSLVEDNDTEGKPKICAVNHIQAKDDKALQEVEEAWISRDLGFNAVWVSDALYKNAAEPTESPGAVIAAMRAKSSVKWASPKARSGKGEGAREYLGDIMM